MNVTQYYIILNIDIFPIINQEKFKIYISIGLWLILYGKYDTRQFLVIISPFDI